MSIVSRYINPYTDFGFKKLFGEEANKDLLIDFLNAVLPNLKTKITDLTFRNPEQLPDNIVDRRAIFDIACIGENGERITVEMQKAKQKNFKKRAMFYTAYAIQRQALRGDWDFDFDQIYLVAVLDFDYDAHEEIRELCRIASLKDQHGKEFLDSIQMAFIQMPMFDKKENELVTKQDKWLYFLKNLETFEGIPAILREPVFEKAFGIAEYLHYTPLQQEAYQMALKVYRDNVAVMKTATESGYTEGKAEGKAEEKADIARNMKAEGLSAALIAKMTGLTVAEVEHLD